MDLDPLSHFSLPDYISGIGELSKEIVGVVGIPVHLNK